MNSHARIEIESDRNIRRRHSTSNNGNDEIGEKHRGTGNASSTYSIWKWRSLQFRRLFFFCVLQVLLIFSWITVSFVLHGSAAWPAGNDSHSSSFLQVMETLAILFYLLHSTLIIFVLISRYAQQLLHDSQGRRLCDFSGFSTLLCILVTLVALETHSHRHPTASIEISGIACFVALSLAALAVFPQMGVSALSINIIKYGTVLLYIVLLALTSLTWSCIILLFTALVSIVVLLHLQEEESRKAYQQYKEMEGEPYGLSKYSGPAVVGFTNLNGSANNNPLLSPQFVEDSVYALQAMIDSIQQHRDLLSREGLLLDYTAAPEVNPVLAGEDQSRGSNPYSSLTGWQWTPLATSLKLNQMICKALFYATTTTPEVLERDKQQFPFNAVCEHVFAMLESVTGRGLALYVNESSTEVQISVPKSLFELIIFLLVHDVVLGDQRGICTLSCEHSPGEGWHVRARTVKIHSDRSSLDGTLYAQQKISATSTEDGTLSDDLTNNSDEREKEKRSADTGRNSLFDFNKMMLPTMFSDPASVGRTLLAQNTLGEKSRAMDRLAARIVAKFVNSRVDFFDPSYKSGVQLLTKLIPLGADQCTPIQHVNNASFTEPPPAVGAAAASTNSDVKDDEDIVENAPLMELQSHLPAPINPSTLRATEQWMFLLRRPHDLEYMADVRDKLEVFNVPNTMLTLSELRASGRSFSVVCVTEAHLSQLANKQMLDMLLELITKSSLVVICEEKERKVSNAVDLKVEYGVEAESMSSSLSMQELFRAVISITSKRTSRIAPIDKADIEREATERLSLYGADGHNERRSSSRLRNHNASDARSNAEMIDRWLVLVRRFKSVVSKYHASGKNRSNIVLLVLNGLDNRMAEIDRMKDPQFEQNTAIISMSGDLSSNSLSLNNRNRNGSWDDGGASGTGVGVSGDTEILDGDAPATREERGAQNYVEHGLLANMHITKRRAKRLVSLFVPMFDELRSLLQAHNMLAIHEITVQKSLLSSDHGLHRLSCWFTTLLETVSIVIDLADRDGTLVSRSTLTGKDSSHLRSGQRGLRSVYSSGIVGYTDRESSFSNSLNKFTDNDEKQGDEESVSPRRIIHDDQVVEHEDDMVAVAGNSMDGAASESKSSAAAAVDPLSFAPDVRSNQLLPLQPEKITEDSRGTGNQRLDPQTVARVAEAVRKVAGISNMTPIISDMIDAIEVSFWDNII